MDGKNTKKGRSIQSPTLEISLQVKVLRMEAA
jgi:hypothetical protein